MSSAIEEAKKAWMIGSIKAKHVIAFTYKDELRVVQPHAFGYNGKVRAFQLYSSKPDAENGWKLFDFDKIDAPIFEPQPTFRAGDRAMPEGIFAEVA